MTVKLASGATLKGTIGAIGADSFDVIERRDAVSQRVTYAEVTELKLAQSTYRSSGSPNTEEVRRVVAGLGVGQHVAVKVTSGQTFRGNIRGINDDHFQFLLDRGPKSMEVAYDAVQQIGPNPSKGVKIAIIIGVAVVAAVIILAVAVSGAVDRLGY